VRQLGLVVTGPLAPPGVGAGAAANAASAGKVEVTAGSTSLTAKHYAYWLIGSSLIRPPA